MRNNIDDEKLPICPGDMLIFMMTGKRMLIIYSNINDDAGNQRDQYANRHNQGQRIAGIVLKNNRYWWEDFWINWRGYNVYWTIHRSKCMVKE
jgi:hypothetical protein